MNAFKRGQTNDKVDQLSLNYLKRTISTRELRLYAYVDYISKNTGEIERSCVNNEELAILEILEKEKQIKKIGLKILISKKFYIFMQEVLYETYVIYGKDHSLELWDNI